MQETLSPQWNSKWFSVAVSARGSGQENPHDIPLHNDLEETLHVIS